MIVVFTKSDCSVFTIPWLPCILGDTAVANSTGLLNTVEPDYPNTVAVGYQRPFTIIQFNLVHFNFILLSSIILFCCQTTIAEEMTIVV